MAATGLLLQHIDRRAEIDVVGLSIHDQCGHGLHARLFGFAEARLGLAQVNDLQIKSGLVYQRLDKGERIETNGATGMVELYFLFHGVQGGCRYEDSVNCPTDDPILPERLADVRRAPFCHHPEFHHNHLIDKMKKTHKNPYHRIEDIVGCKWSVSVLMAVHAGICRPGELERHIDGISTRILNVRLGKLTDYGLLSKCVHDEKPFRTVYSLTPDGVRFIGLLTQLRQLDRTLGQSTARTTSESSDAGATANRSK